MFTLTERLGWSLGLAMLVSLVAVYIELRISKVANPSDIHFVNLIVGYLEFRFLALLIQVYLILFGVLGLAEFYISMFGEFFELTLPHWFYLSHFLFLYGFSLIFLAPSLSLVEPPESLNQSWMVRMFSFLPIKKFQPSEYILSSKEMADFFVIQKIVFRLLFFGLILSIFTYFYIDFFSPE